MAGTPECPPVEDLQRFLIGQLSDTEANALERHLGGCPQCLKTVEQLTPDDALVEVVTTLAHGQTTVPEEPDADLVAALVRLHGRTSGGDRSRDADTVPRLSGSTPSGDELHAWHHLLALPTAADELGQLGPYAILRLLGQGGMGVVFAAQQSRPRRLVALKMILAGPRGGRQRLDRFRAEAEIIAGLQHPHIVPIYEVGDHDDRPYFTMELLDGGSLAQKLAAAPLAHGAAARLVEIIARAIHFAHERGVIHRDLKPANVLLTAAGVPKIADFGLAKQFAADSGEATESGAVLGTPAYMAPEQFGGQTIGPAVDVYALGAILYECLTGRPPFRAATPLETLDQARRCDPVPPGRLQPGLPRDLQTICLKCLDKEPARRYASARDLADDLDRFLRLEPIRARPVGWPERLVKWARRQPALAALVIVSGLSLIGFLAGLLIHESQLRSREAEAQRQRELATNNYRAARDTLARMLGRLEGKRLADVPRLKELRQDLLEDTLAFYQEILKGADDPDPAVRQDVAEALVQTGAIQQLMGRKEAAAENFRQAAAMLEGLPENLRQRPEMQSRLAECWDYLGVLSGQLGEYEKFYRKALDIRERLAAAEPDNPVWQNQLAKAEHHMGDVFLLTERLTEAELHYSRAVEIRTRLIREHPENRGFQSYLAEDHVNLGLLYSNMKRPADAEASYKTAEDLLGPLVRDHPEEVDYALSLSGAFNNWGNLLRGMGKLPEALQRETQAVDLAEAVLLQEPHHDTARTRAYSAHGARAQMYDALGRWADAVKDWERVVELDQSPTPWKHRLFLAFAFARREITPERPPR